MPKSALRPARPLWRLGCQVTGVATILVMLAGCAETQLAVHSVKRIGAQNQTSAPAQTGAYKIGKPYEIAGQWYYPAVDYEYRETGIASWYGPKFHGKYTANGEIFDQNEVSAAHRTLPLPSIVRVTNLENGRSLKVRINDRGPFARSRIIDMSRKAAQLLGFEQKGTAKVMVEVLEAESQQAALIAQGKGGSVMVTAAEKETVTAAPRASVETVSLDAPQSKKAPGDFNDSPAPALAKRAKYDPASVTNDAAVTAQANPEVNVSAVPPSAIYVQAGAFSVYDNALNLRNQLYNLAPTKIEPIDVKGTTFYRVRLGPMATVPEADVLLERVLASGQTGARVIVECAGAGGNTPAGC
ncbi:septal ring lytic transglycosylase RlpA family protein [Thalassospira mesophila]|uniref:septal ring lytic transglycosylase RlpA family protein n=1 Tax=Thalassospira mesophila TaxID=1293891 RepID=UPI000A1F74AC|nr:septal ring lytic transglycosylase RlpA family protein [Thalassospira mesophila]